MADLRLNIEGNFNLNTQQAQQQIDELQRRSAAADNPNHQSMVSPSSSPFSSPFSNIPNNPNAPSLNPLFNQYSGNPNVQNILRDSTISAAEKMKQVAEITEKLSKEFSILTNVIRNNSQEQQIADRQENETQQEQREEEQKQKDEQTEILKKIFNHNVLKDTVNAATGIARTLSSGHLSYIQAQTQGDILGAEISNIDTAASTVQQVGQFVGSVAMLIPGLGVGVGALIQALGAIGSTGLSIYNDRNKEDKIYYDTYVRNLPDISRVGSTFGGDIVANKTANQNSDDAIIRWTKLAETYNQDTGMDNSEFMSLSTSLARYGISDVDKAGNYAQKAAKLSRFTNGDSSQAQSYADYMGLIARYSSEDSISALAGGFVGAKESGLKKGQYSEFLSGLQKVVEDGIANGYVKSTKEVSETMTMFSKLSNNSEFWKGQQGFQRLQTINNSLANITGLSSTTDLLAYQGFASVNDSKKRNILNGEYAESNKYGADSDTINNFLLAERGIDNASFPAIAKMLKNTYGEAKNENSLEKIMAIKNMTGLNYTGAKQIYDMMYNEGSGIADYESKVNEMKSKGYVDDLTIQKNFMSKMEAYVTNIGKDVFKRHIPDMRVTLDNFYTAYMRREGRTVASNTASLKQIVMDGSMSHSLNSASLRGLNDIRAAAEGLSPTADAPMISKYNRMVEALNNDPNKLIIFANYLKRNQKMNSESDNDYLSRIIFGYQNINWRQYSNGVSVTRGDSVDDMAYSKTNAINSLDYMANHGQNWLKTMHVGGDPNAPTYLEAYKSKIRNLAAADFAREDGIGYQIQNWNQNATEDDFVSASESENLLNMLRSILSDSVGSLLLPLTEGINLLNRNMQEGITVDSTTTFAS